MVIGIVRGASTKNGGVVTNTNERFVNFLFPSARSRLRERLAEVSTIKSLKGLATAIAVMVVCAVIGGAAISVLVVREFRAIDENWVKYDGTNAAKGFLLSQIRGHFGYGGFIHNFKDYVFKGDPDLEGVVRTDLDQLKASIANYGIVGATEKEVAAVRGLRTVISDYERRFKQVADGVYDGLGPVETDRLVSIDDRRALSALSTLEIVWLEARDAETKALNQHVRVGQALITGEAIFILFLGAFLTAMVWFLRRVIREIETRTIALEAEIAERGAAEHRLYVAKEETEAANWTKANLLANMSHDLRTPLNAIIGFAGAMREGVFGTIEQDKYNEYLSDIEESARRLDGFISDVMELSIIDSGELKLDPQPLDVEQLISSCVAVLRQRAEHAGIAISVSIIGHL